MTARTITAPDQAPAATAGPQPPISPFALAHSINACHRPLAKHSRNTGRPDEADLAVERLYLLYQRQSQPSGISPRTFHRQLSTKLRHFPSLLDAEDRIPGPKKMEKIFAEYDDHTRRRYVRPHDDEDPGCQIFKPPPAPKTPEDFRRQEQGLTVNQKNYRRRKEALQGSLGIWAFFDIFGTPLLSDLFIAGHRWPHGKAVCPHCGSPKTEVFHRDTPEPDDAPETGQDPDTALLQEPSTGPDLSWTCQFCGHDFTATTGTIIQSPNLPPADWFLFALLLLTDRSGSYEHDLTDHASAFYGLELTWDEARTMRDRIRYALPFAKPNTRRPIDCLDALKILAMTEDPETA